MTKWVVRYVFEECGHNSGRLDILERDKRTRGDLAWCPLCGADRVVDRVEGRSA